MSRATDHSKAILLLRDEAYKLRGMVWNPAREARELALRAAADLLEMHDATGLNLCNAPNLLAFVEHHAEITVTDNHA